MSPVSSPASIRIVVTPVTDSPFAIAHWMGAAPRYLGNSEACKFKFPKRGQIDHPLRNDAAIADDDDRVRAAVLQVAREIHDVVLDCRGLRNRDAERDCRLFHGGGVLTPFRARAGGRAALRPETSEWPAATSLSSVGTAKRGVPQKIRFISRLSVLSYQYYSCGEETDSADSSVNQITGECIARPYE